MKSIQGRTATAIAAEKTKDALILVKATSPPTQRSPCETDSPGAIETDSEWTQKTQQPQREQSNPQHPREGSTALLLSSLAFDCIPNCKPKTLQTGEDFVSLLMRLRGGGGSSEEKPSESNDDATRKRPRTADTSEAASQGSGTTAANNPTSTSLGPGADSSAAPPPAKRGRKKRPKEMPRRPLSAYNLFFKHERDRLTQQQSTVEIIQLATEIKEPPEGAPPWTLFQALSILIPKRWHALQNSDKIQYEEMAKESMAEYQKKLHLYQIQKARLSLEEHEAAARQQEEQLQQQAHDHHHEDEDQEEEDEDSKMPAAAMPPQPPAVGDFSNLLFPGLLYPQAISSAAAGDAGTTGASSNIGTTTTGERVSGSDTSETRSQQATMIDPMVALQSQLMAQLNPQHANTTAATLQIHESPLEPLIRISASQQQPVGPQPAAAPSSSSSETNNSSLAASGLEPEGIVAISNLVQALRTLQGTPYLSSQHLPSQGHELPADPAQAILFELTRALAPPPPPPQPDPALVNALQTMLQSVLQGMQQQQQQQEGGNEDGAGAQTTNQNQNMQALFMAFLQALVSVSQQSSDSNCNIS